MSRKRKHKNQTHNQINPETTMFRDMGYPTHYEANKNQTAKTATRGAAYGTSDWAKSYTNANYMTAPKRAFIVDGITVWGAPGRLIHRYDWALRIRIGGVSFHEADRVQMLNGAAALFDQTKMASTPPPTMDLPDWDDFGVPTFHKAWWEALLAGIQSLPKGSNVVIACLGGHGRTGTALAILAGLAGIGGEDPVAFIRKTYDKGAVESEEQIEYIEDLLNISIKALPAYGRWDSVNTKSKTATLHGYQSGVDYHKYTTEPAAISDAVQTGVEYVERNGVYVPATDMHMEGEDQEVIDSGVVPVDTLIGKG